MIEYLPWSIIGMIVSGFGLLQRLDSQVANMLLIIVFLGCFWITVDVIIVFYTGEE